MSKRSLFRAGLREAVEQQAAKKKVIALPTRPTTPDTPIVNEAKENDSASEVSSFTQSERQLLMGPPTNARAKCERWLQSSEDHETGLSDQGVVLQENMEVEESSNKSDQVQSINTVNNMTTPTIFKDLDVNSNVMTADTPKISQDFKRCLFPDKPSINSKDKEAPPTVSINNATSAKLNKVDSDTFATNETFASCLSEETHVSPLNSKSTPLNKCTSSAVLESNDMETSAMNETLRNGFSTDKLADQLFVNKAPQLEGEIHSTDINAVLSLDKSSGSDPTTICEKQTDSSFEISLTPEILDMDMTLPSENRGDESQNVDTSLGSNMYDVDLPFFQLTDAGLVPIQAAVGTDLEQSILQEQAVDDIPDDSGENITENVEPEIQNFVNIELRTPAAARGRVKDRNVQPAAPLKKIKNPSLWKVNDAKVKRHLGLAYKSKEGKEYSAKTMRASCGLSCKNKCDTQVTEEDREYFKDRYYTKNENQTKKWLFILNFVESKAVDHSKEDENADEPRTPQKKKRSRSCHNEYYMERKNGTKVKVCKDMFKSTLVISDSTITTALKKRGSPEKRGKVGVKRIIAPEVINSVHNHIRKFPRVEAHYCRKDTTYEYLEEKVDSIANMYRLYLEWMESNHNGEQKATLRQYTDQFNTLKIKIFQPRKDLCDHCFSYGNIPDEQRTPEVVECHQNHILQKDLANSLYKEDREAFLKDSTVAVSSFDMEKTHLLPQCRAGDVYYCKKLKLNNFTIKEVRTAQGYCYVWDESIAKRGANEVSSFLHTYLEQRSQEGVKTFHFWSDNCGPQNKNRYLFGMYMAAAAKFEIKIVHRYLMKGHTSNDADGMHSLIERKTSKMDLYVPEDWYTAIENVKKTGKKFIVKRTKTEDIKDYHDFVDNKTVWYKDENGSIVRWSEIVDISVSHEDPWKLYFKYHHGDEYTPVVIRKKTAGRPINLKTYQHTCAYNEPPKIEVSKKKELLELCETLIVPLRAHDFYESLVSS